MRYAYTQIRSAAFVLGALLPAALAAAERQPTEAEIEAAARRLVTPDAREVERLERSLRAGSATPQATDAPKAPALDLEALARRYGEATRQQQRSFLDESTLLVFVSLSLPRETLNRIVEQAERAKATLVMRGLKGRSMTQTTQQVAAVIGERRVAWQIDPRAFKQFEVQAVPAYALVKAGATVSDCASGRCLSPQQWATVEGDVTFAYALRAIGDKAPQFRPDAAGFLARLGG